MRPKVSVIIPCYNYDKYVEQCIMSVLLQKVDFNIEIIVGDDNSTDNSFAIVSRLKHFYQSDKVEFKIIRHETNIGEINNTKSLLSSASGEYIAYLDADDFWIDPQKLTKQIEFLDSNWDHSLCITGFFILEKNKYIPTDDLTQWMCPTDINSLNSESLCKFNIVGSSSSRVFRNYGDSIVKDYFYDFPYSDWVMNLELSFRGKIGYLDFPTYVYRIHDKSLSHKEIRDDAENRTELVNKRIGILNNIFQKKNLIV